MNATMLASNTQHCWAQHVASICMEPQQCWHLFKFKLHRQLYVAKIKMKSVTDHQ